MYRIKLKFWERQLCSIYNQTCFKFLGGYYFTFWQLLTESERDSQFFFAPALANSSVLLCHEIYFSPHLHKTAIVLEAGSTAAAGLALSLDVQEITPTAIKTTNTINLIFQYPLY